MQDDERDWFRAREQAFQAAPVAQQCFRYGLPVREALVWVVVLLPIPIRLDRRAVQVAAIDLVQSGFD